MFGFLRGVVAHKGHDRVHLDVHGAGYEVFIPDTVHRRLAVGREVTLLTHCHIREDAFQIYGFLREEEKTLFRLLLAVSGIGPKVALAVMSAMAPSEFARAIHDSDVAAFTRVNGVGKKTAQRIVLEIKAKLGQDAELSAILGEEAPEDDAAADDVIAALIALGCTHAEAKRAAAGARKQLGDAAPPEELVRAALRGMAHV